MRLFPVLSLILLLVVGWAIVDEYRTDWRSWQAAFAPVEAEHAQPGAAREIGIEQVFLPDLDRVDRCTSCHLGIDDPAFVTAEQPFRTHSGPWLDSHRMSDFGCTSCHGGQGAATNYVDAAHAPIPHWHQPMRAAELMQANCGVCHREREPAGAYWLARGRQQIVDSNCVGCHEIPGFDDDDDLRAPVLDSLDGKLRPGWSRRWLENPESTLPGSRMPDFRLDAGEVEVLEAFLQTQRSVPLLDEAGTIDWSQADSKRGGVLFRTARCVTCHKVKGRGGDLGPELTHVGTKATREWLYSYLEDPFRFQPDTLMLRFRFGDDELRDLAFHLSQELIDRKTAVPDEPSPKPQPEHVEQGREVFLKRGCHGCHPLEGMDELARIGPSHEARGSQPIDPRLLEQQGMEPTVPNWLFTKLRKPESLTRVSRMPGFRLAEREAGAVTLALMSLRQGELPSARITDDPERPAYIPQGRFGELATRYRCLSCHQIQGTGGTLSTVPLDRIGSQLQTGYVETYLDNPGAVRVNLEERMPKFNLQPEEIDDIVRHLTQVFVDDELERPIALDDEAAGRGERLYDELGCRGCHILGRSGGFVGPDLGDSGRRLETGWVMAWLLDPEGWKPGTLQPDYGLEPEQARALTAYIMTLKREEKGAAR